MGHCIGSDTASALVAGHIFRDDNNQRHLYKENKKD